MQNLKHLLMAGLLASLLLAAPIGLMAQEEEPAAAEMQSAAPGISTLIFLLGAGAIIVVGGAMMARDNFQSETDETVSS
ncbi:MAG: hypothetical protein CL610_01300 [Anaerolineaceae bacterium]|nr:hypothetical protein [Anaerolineaceae bacterium]